MKSLFQGRCLFWGECVFFLLWVSLVTWPWLEWRGTSAEPSAAERQLGLSVIHAQLGGVITGSSIVLAGVGAMVGISLNRLRERRGTTLRHLRASAGWSVAALALSLYTMATLPHLIPLQNPVKSAQVNVMAAMSLVLVFLAGLRLVLGVWAATRK